MIQARASRAIGALVLAAAVLAASSPSQADGRWRHRGGWGGGHDWAHGGGGYRGGGYRGGGWGGGGDAGAAIAGGVIGLAAGALLGGALGGGYGYGPPGVAYPPPEAAYPPPAVYYGGDGDDDGD